MTQEEKEIVRSWLSWTNTVSRLRALIMAHQTDEDRQAAYQRRYHDALEKAAYWRAKAKQRSRSCLRLVTLH